MSSLSIGVGHLVRRGIAAVAGRSNDDGQHAMAVVLFCLNAIVLLPLFLFISYTLCSVVPILTMVEDPDPTPAYSALPSFDNVEEGPDPTAAAEATRLRKPDNAALPAVDGIVTSSLRATLRHLHRIGGPRAFFRGFVCHATIKVLTVFLTAPFILLSWVPFPVFILAINLALVQLQVTWVHIVISARPSVAFWRRLPRFVETFRATKAVVGLLWLADVVTHLLPYLIVRLLRPAAAPVDSQTSSDHGHGWVSVRLDIGFRHVLAGAVFLALAAFVWLPAYVAAVRVQASLLPPDEETIVAFDRSFATRVAPTLADGAALASVREALATFPRASWVRLYKIFSKIFLLSVVACGLAWLLMALEFVVITAIFGPKK